ncbi:MAG: FAD-dependent oxidoreductase [Ardenticatenaceae bacterium]|nr:FAD-dependent oxidoreductase [Ardenticatenaceae bacterium]
MSHYKYVILGGGLAAGYAAQEFVAQGISAGELCLVAAEKTLPYERPPLSKAFLAGEKSTEEVLINEPSFYADNGIVVMSGTAVTRVDFKQKELYTTGEGDPTIGYDKLLIATGAKPRTFNLPGSALSNIFYLRRIEDAQQIRQQAAEARQAVVIGGSFIAMEVTAVLQSRGVQTTMVFPEERVWQAFFTPRMSAYFTSYYQDKGVTILPGTGIASFAGHGRVRQVITQDGQALDADMVVAGIGVKPNSALFEGSGLQLKDGYVQVNRFLETNIPDVVAAGDVTLYRDLVFERPLHLEHWDNARSQAEHAARLMLGIRRAYEHVPYFFSDIFDLSYEFWGDTEGAAQAVHRGRVEDGEFSTWWLAADGRLLAAFVLNRPDEERELAPAWIKAGKKLSAESLRRPTALQEARATMGS